MQAVGQTRPGRLGDAPPGGGAGGQAAGGGPAGAAAPAGGSPAKSPASNPRALIEELVRGNRVVIFSKVICPSSRKAKQIISAHLPGPNQFTVIELDQRPDGAALQDALEQMTGKRTVPNVWIGGEFIGGADDLDQLESSGQLAARLSAAA